MIRNLNFKYAENDEWDSDDLIAETKLFIYKIQYEKDSYCAEPKYYTTFKSLNSTEHLGDFDDKDKAIRACQDHYSNLMVEIVTLDFSSENEQD